ncbi:MAG: purine-binding chemotaxis protein CheW [Deltaproteobacteria bacterium]|nr:purine-binding chemotaxis protein CheW [Deltaproteobacteria bacterium]
MNDTQSPMTRTNLKEISLFERDLYGKAPPAEASLSLMKIALSGECYAVDALLVRDIVVPTSITPLPFVPKHIVGVMNLRGAVLSICDLRSFLGIPTNSANPASTRIVVVESGGVATGIRADSARELITIAASTLRESNKKTERNENSLVSSIIEWKGKALGILDVPKILARTRLTTPTLVNQGPISIMEST